MGTDPKGPNELLFSLLFERLKAIHDQEYILSADEAGKYMEQLHSRPRDCSLHPFPFRFTAAAGGACGGGGGGSGGEKSSDASQVRMAVCGLNA